MTHYNRACFPKPAPHGFHDAAFDLPRRVNKKGRTISDPSFLYLSRCIQIYFLTTFSLHTPAIGFLIVAVIIIAVITIIIILTIIIVIGRKYRPHLCKYVLGCRGEGYGNCVDTGIE
jgi:hypothetical protein